MQPRLISIGSSPRIASRTPQAHHRLSLARVSRPDKRQRVVVTGFGALSPVGNSAAESWAAVVAGQSGVATITRFDPTDYETRFAGEVKGFDPDAILGKK